MAGELEEPFRFDFQADLLHSGSISFGRFESESLSWERRSSFSHNRYLEEVEKYSKPGSVTEKKAYFEAHFRRKALLKQNSSQTSKNSDQNDDEFLDYNEEIEAHKCLKENLEIINVEDDNESKYVNIFDEEAKIQECERKKIEFLSVSPQNEQLGSMGDHLASVPEQIKLEKAHQSGTENGVLVESEESTGHTVNDVVVQMDVASEASDSSLTSQAAEKDVDSSNSGFRRMFAPKVSSASEHTKSKLKSRANGAQVQSTISSAASNGSVKSKMRESEGSLMKNKEKKSPRPASPIARPGGKYSKSEDSSMNFSKAKMLHPKKSIMKELPSEKAFEGPSSVLEKSKSTRGAGQTANRPKQSISPSNPHMNQRAERRKEEKTATTTDMREFRKSLNFKATPMPSFYNESARCSDRNKVISTSKTLNKPEKRNDISSTTPSDTRPSSSTLSFNKSYKTRSSETARKNYVSEKREKEPEASKAPRVREVSRKSTRGTNMGSGSKLSYLAVDVA